MSSGLAVADEPNLTALDLLSRVDMLMYQVKFGSATADASRADRGSVAGLACRGTGTGLSLSA